MNDKKKVSVIILAAGFSSRMGKDKALLSWQNKMLIEYVVDKIAPFSNDIIVVCGKNCSKLYSFINFAEYELKLVENPNPENGMFSSLRIGINEIRDNPFFIQPIDVPFVKKETYQMLLNSYKKEYDCFKPSIKIAGKYCSGHPILLSAEMRKVICEQPLDTKLNDVLEKYAEKTKYVEVADQAILQNINTPEEWRKITEK